MNLFNFAFILKDAMYLGVIAFMSWLFYKAWKLSKEERKELLDRIMSKNYEQFEYYQNMFQEEVEELKKMRGDAREIDEIDEEIKEEQDLEYKKEKKFLDQVDEDFNEEDVDLPELRKRIEEK